MEGKTLFYKSIYSDKLTLVKWKITHPRRFGKHKLVSKGFFKGPEVEWVGKGNWIRDELEMDNGEYDQNTLHKA